MNLFPLGRVWTIFLAMVAIAGCAGGSYSLNRQLESLSIAPASASASVNNTAVQFTATSYWNLAPTTVTPQSATWGACSASGPTSDVTVSTTGLATCASTAKGTYTVFAWTEIVGATGPVCNAVSACGYGCGRAAATALLTCP